MPLYIRFSVNVFHVQFASQYFLYTHQIVFLLAEQTWACVTQECQPHKFTVDDEIPRGQELKSIHGRQTHVVYRPPRGGFGGAGAAAGKPDSGPDLRCDVVGNGHDMHRRCKIPRYRGFSIHTDKDVPLQALFKESTFTRLFMGNTFITSK